MPVGGGGVGRGPDSGPFIYVCMCVNFLLQSVLAERYHCQMNHALKYTMKNYCTTSCLN